TGKFYFYTRDRLYKGDRCLLYTDGMVDCRNGPEEHDREFGFDRLKAVFERSCSLPLDEARTAIASEFENYVENNADDDASFLILEITAD
ncbi:MAG: SpoIIE family protein phosphatase, partial [Spirochaetia bacterium]|nr:SpoIIE family protein phosphatase [Spirochaetia bacterium]